MAISSLAVASGTGAFLALATGHKGTAIGFALIGGALGLAAAFGQALERETDRVGATVYWPPTVVGTAPHATVAGFMGGRILGRG